MAMACCITEIGHSKAVKLCQFLCYIVTRLINYKLSYKLFAFVNCIIVYFLTV